MEKVAIITGASGAIGRSIAERLAKDGFAVVLSGHPNDPELEITTRVVAAHGHGVLQVAAEITKASDVAGLFEGTLKAFGGVDVVIHNAGFMHPALISTDSASLELFDQTIKVNLRGTFLVLAQAAQHVREHGRIVVMSSSVIARPGPGYGAYLSSKAAIEGLMRVLANELRGREISVNAIAPGPIATEFFLKWKTPAEIENIAKLSPFERLGEPGDVAALTSFLAGPDGEWINAQSVRTNGGFA